MFNLIATELARAIAAEKPNAGLIEHALMRFAAAIQQSTMEEMKREMRRKPTAFDDVNRR